MVDSRFFFVLVMLAKYAGVYECVFMRVMLFFLSLSIFHVFHERVLHHTVIVALCDHFSCLLLMVDEVEPNSRNRPSVKLYAQRVNERKK